MDPDVYRRMTMVQNRHWWYEGRRRIISSFIKRLGLPVEARILEAGCGPGANLGMLSEHGDISAFEPDDFAIQYAREHSGIDPGRIAQGFLPAPIPFSEPFDLVCAFDVIEHIDDDIGSLKALRELTADGAYALFTVPAFPFLWSQHDVVNHHKRRYTRDSFTALLSASGYQICFISYYNMWLFPAVAIVRLIKNALRVKDSPDESIPFFSWLNSALCFLFASEAWLLRIMPLPFGVSLIALCRKV